MRGTPHPYPSLPSFSRSSVVHVRTSRAPPAQRNLESTRHPPQHRHRPRWPPVERPKAGPLRNPRSGYKAFLWLSPNPRACLHTAPVFSCSTNNKALPNPSTTQAPPEPFDTGTGRGSAPRPVTRAAVFPAEAFTREIIDSTASRRRASRVSASDALARSTKVTNRVQGNQSPPGPRKLMDPYHLLMMFMCFFVCLILLGVFSANPVRLKSPCPGMYHAQFDGEGGQATLPTTNVVSWTENPLFDLCRGERP